MLCIFQHIPNAHTYFMRVTPSISFFLSDCMSYIFKFYIHELIAFIQKYNRLVYMLHLKPGRTT